MKTTLMTTREVYGPFPPRERPGQREFSHAWAVRYRTGSLVTEYLFMEQTDADQFAAGLRAGRSPLEAGSAKAILR